MKEKEVDTEPLLLAFDFYEVEGRIVTREMVKAALFSRLYGGCVPRVISDILNPTPRRVISPTLADGDSEE